MTSAKVLAVAFARQAASDLRLYALLREQEVPKCHRLHFLQMASEKACKAHLYISQTGPLAHYLRHDVVEKVLSAWMRRKPVAYSGGLHASVRAYAREIDRLAPSVDREARPDNTEYPWLDLSQEVHIPCEERFTSLDDFDHRFTATYKAIQLAISEILDREPS